MKTLSIITALIMLSTTVFGNEQAAKCEQLKGSWEWNGSVNEWQCLDVNRTMVDPAVLASITIEANTTQSLVQPSGNGLTATKAVAYVAAPVFIAGAIVAAVVISPIILVKWAFGKK